MEARLWPLQLAPSTCATSLIQHIVGHALPKPPDCLPDSCSDIFPESLDFLARVVSMPTPKILYYFQP